LRRDPQAFEALALRVHDATAGRLDPWPRIAEMGRGVDPGNPLYGEAPGAVPALSVDAVDDDTVARFDAESRSAPDLADPVDDGPALGEPVADLAESAFPAFDEVPSQPPPSIDLGPEPEQGDNRDFALEIEPRGETAEASDDSRTWAADAAAAGSQSEVPDLSDLSDATSAPAAPDLSEPAAGDAVVEEAEAPPVDHPLARKLALAEEFARIGDLEAARDLLTEVTLGRDPALKARAEALLDELG
jgi:pilus assembly protein FimV